MKTKNAVIFQLFSALSANSAVRSPTRHDIIKVMITDKDKQIIKETAAKYPRKTRTALWVQPFP